MLTLAELGALRGFVRDVMGCWPDGGLDGGELQDIAARHGLLAPGLMTAPCGDNCACAEYCSPEEFADGVRCMRKTELLMACERTRQAAPDVE